MRKSRGGRGSRSVGMLGESSIALITAGMDVPFLSGLHLKVRRTMRNNCGTKSIDVLTRRRRRTMKTFEFSIIASGLDPEARDFADRFFNAGCDDATISFHKGHIIVDFAREADSVDGAISSAVECVKKAGAQVDRIEPDPLVSLSDIAARVCARL